MTLLHNQGIEPLEKEGDIRVDGSRSILVLSLYSYYNLVVKGKQRLKRQTILQISGGRNKLRKKMKGYYVYHINEGIVILLVVKIIRFMAWCSCPLASQL